jgi:hypothetical protein
MSKCSVPSETVSVSLRSVGQKSKDTSGFYGLLRNGSTSEKLLVRHHCDAPKGKTENHCEHNFKPISREQTFHGSPLLTAGFAGLGKIASCSLSAETVCATLPSLHNKPTRTPLSQQECLELAAGSSEKGEFYLHFRVLQGTHMLELAL